MARKRSEKKVDPDHPRRPGDDSFQQQRLRAWQPLLTPRTVVPTLLIIALVFLPIGGILYHFSQTVLSLTIDYTDCARSAAADQPVQLDSTQYSYVLTDKNVRPSAPSYHWVNSSRTPGGKACQLDFDVPLSYRAPVYFYYRLENFYQNHRRYVQSYDLQQLQGDVRTAKDLSGQQGFCQPLAWETWYVSIGNNTPTKKNIPIYPCGLIANSVFNDTYTSPVLLDSNGQPTGTMYNMSEKGITYPGEMSKYGKSKYNPDQVVPPPFWQGATGPYGQPTGHYTNDSMFDPSKDEHFAVWMRVAALSNFRKMWMRNDHADLPAGRYRIEIQDNFPVAMFKGRKAIVLANANWTGGANSFMGVALMVVGAISLLCGLAFLVRHVVKPRRVGDPTYLSWYRKNN